MCDRSAVMADGNVFRLVEEVLSPVSAFLDGLFYAGALYGATSILNFSWQCLKGVRTYFFPFGRFSRREMVKEFGKWALITGGTSGIGLAFAHEVCICSFSGVWCKLNYSSPKS